MEEDIEKIALEALEKANLALEETKTLKEKIANLKKTDTAILYEIKDMLGQNSKVTTSAKRNAKGWGVLSVILSVVGEFLRIFLFSKFAF